MAIHIALAKGRIHKAVMKYLADSGYEFPTYSEESRRLIFEDAKGQLKVTLVKSPDVAVYVERGAADVGIVGKDVLLEEAPDVLIAADEKGKILVSSAICSCLHGSLTLRAAVRPARPAQSVTASAALCWKSTAISVRH